ncbi:uncharacterized protein LOC106667877 [Cimex lectularius]|uniref:F-box domain-containing protein n=1 Tax=Cimex lectularius TaxID=79782 RepID=A0A8I6RU99_CIMLE|nr:uncharacterized protein LOC106667877 [Cimex lectularius]
MNRILRVEESNDKCVPRHLELLVERMGKDRLFHDVKPGDEGFLPVECELIFALGVVIALEEGFRMDEAWNTIGYDRRVFDSLLKMSNFRTKTGTLSVELLLPLSHGFRFHLSTAIILNNCTLVTVISEDNKGKCFSSSAAIENDKYLKTSEKGAAIFEKISELCAIVKKPIYLAKLNAWRSLNQVFPDIFCLPEDVKRFLFKKLRAPDFVKLCSSSSKISPYLNEDDIWRYNRFKTISLL